MKTSERLTFFAIEAVFAAAVIAAGAASRLPEPEPALLLALIGLAAFRAGRAVSENLIFKPLRDVLGIVEVDDSSGAGQSVAVETPPGPRRVAAELISCVICSGTWAAVALVLLYSCAPALGLALLYTLAGAGVLEVLYGFTENQFWGGRRAREQAGTAWYYKNTPEIIADIKARSQTRAQPQELVDV